MPKHIVTPDGNILIAALTQPFDSLALNYFNNSTHTFSGWNSIGKSKPECYTFSISDGGIIGFTFIGGEGSNEGDVIYFETTNNGITWSLPQKIFDCPAEQGIAVGALRGISLNFSGEQPCVVFEVCQQDFNADVYYPRLPNEILFWSPNINGGVPKIIADSSNVPFYPSLGQVQVFPPVSRPVIGRVNDYNNILVVAFNASTENVYVGTDSISYFAGYLTYSTNGGVNWKEPQKFTPDEPLLDWKYISTPIVYPVFDVIPSQTQTTILNYVLQADSLQGYSNPSILNAQYYYASSEIPIADIWNTVEVESPFSDFRLEQNYPNPFNPSTTISYEIAQQGFVNLKVFDILGNEVAVLVNKEKPAGIYQLEFDGANLPSGIYFYKLEAGDFVLTKKMILLR